MHYFCMFTLHFWPGNTVVHVYGWKPLLIGHWKRQLLLIFMHNVWKCTVQYYLLIIILLLGLNDFIFVLQMQLLAAVLSMARELDPSYWTMWPALGLNLDFMTVLTMELAFITVPTLKMLVPLVRFNVSDVWRTSAVNYQSDALGTIWLVLNAKFLDLSLSNKSDISYLKNQPSLWNHSDSFKGYHSQTVSCSVGITSSWCFHSLSASHRCVYVALAPWYLELANVPTNNRHRKH